MIQSIYDGLLQTVNCFGSSASELATEDSFQEKASHKSVLGFTQAQAELRKKKANLLNSGACCEPSKIFASELTKRVPHHLLAKIKSRQRC